MDTRQRILSNICKGLLLINVENGYTNTIKEVRKGFYKNTTITNYPTACVYFGLDVLNKQLEGEAFGDSVLELVVLIYLNSNKDRQIDDAEKIIEDLFKYFNRHESIKTDCTSDLVKEPYVQNYFIWKINPYVNETDNAVAAGIILKVEYMNFVD